MNKYKINQRIRVKKIGRSKIIHIEGVIKDYRLGVSGYEYDVETDITFLYSLNEDLIEELPTDDYGESKYEKFY